MVRETSYWLSLLLLCSCTTDLSVPDYQNFSEKLIVNGTISPQEGAYIEVSALLNPENLYTVTDQYILDATVTLKGGDGNTLDLMVYDGNIGYKLSQPISIEHGRSYTIEAIYRDYPKASAMIEIPPAIYDLNGKIVEVDDNGRVAKVTLSYLEPPDALMHYRMMVYGDNRSRNRAAHDYPDSDIGDVSSFFCNRNNPTIYDNSCQSTPSVEVDLWVFGVVRDINTVREQSREFVIHENLEFVIESITPGYKGYAAYVDNLPTDIDLLFTDQHETPTNVHNGFGYVAGKSIHSIKFNL